MKCINVVYKNNEFRYVMQYIVASIVNIEKQTNSLKIFLFNISTKLSYWKKTYYRVFII